MSSSSTSSTAPPSEREILRKHFDQPYAAHNNLWDDLWQKGDFLPWDKGEAGPALADALAQRTDLLGGPEVKAEQGARRRKRALVPGCGRGHDVLFLAGQGYDAYGLEISSAAVKACQEAAGTEYSRYMKGDVVAATGTYHFVQGDFFKDAWVEELDAQKGFDLIYDYTFFCALPPVMRPAWALRYTQLLAKDGRLVCLEFPTYKAPSTGGPPFGLTPDAYVAHLTHPGEKLPYTAEGYPEESTYSSDSKPGDSALERIGHWKAERTFKIGQGTDHVSVWRHRSSQADEK